MNMQWWWWRASSREYGDLTTKGRGLVQTSHTNTPIILIKRFSSNNWSFICKTWNATLYP